jgi:hypothetical protein
MDFNKLNQILDSGTIEELEKFCSENNLSIENNKIVSNNKNEINKEIAFWDKRQLVKKINLNS